MFVLKQPVRVLSFFLFYLTVCHSERLKSTSKTLFVKELSIVSNVSIRYANVLVRSLVENLETEDDEISFQVRIPKEAFITSFSIITSEKTINAVIKEKDVAAEEYNSAKEEGVNAGTVTQQTNVADDIGRDIFNVKVNVAAQTTLEFRLEYEELLKKNAGKYSQKLFVDSDHVIPRLEVFCEYREKQNFKQFSYQNPLDGRKIILRNEEMSDDGSFIRKVQWNPSVSQQDSTQFGFTKPFEIEYELEPPKDGGIVYYNGNGEFVHFFSPTSCEEEDVMSKQIVFVIDISGSMQNDPVKQVRQTMAQILSRLRLKDYFNIVIFNDYATSWSTRFRQATAANIEDAKQFVSSKVIAKGSTNINDALLKAISLFSQTLESSEDFHIGQMVVFLTDGSPTVGVTNREDIRQNVRDINFYDGVMCCKSIIHAIAFGKGADRNFLRTLAHENEGTLTIVRDIDEESESFIDLYHGIESPFYKNIEFTFTADEKIIPEANITRPQFKLLDCNADIVVAGRTYPNAEIHSVIIASENNDRVVFDNITTVRTRDIDEKKLARLFIYERVKQLLEEADISTDSKSKKLANDKALELSLEHKFVTPLTSLVVTEYSPEKLTNIPGPTKSNSKTKNNQGASSFGTGAIYDAYDYGVDDLTSQPDYVDIDNSLQLVGGNSASFMTFNYGIKIISFLTIQILYKLFVYFF
ncbi:inter-alpha-trypsin inhibitor heavy chain H4-like [Ruditapes philippinarum]|uniref:inter-alpha-trypsin inhibitor heavy chain H4-like n=1 Tax=Ruditapes philippinarum TaxID=129788 RepID=UPI00295B5EF2|nr:inter-alpha-trypsin inhibitor heavy chain H4-like [Ruditapes philippinarum]